MCPPHLISPRLQVSAILVLYGLPRLLTGAILAHELMHAWLRMKNVTGLRIKVGGGGSAWPLNPKP